MECPDVRIVRVASYRLMMKPLGFIGHGGNSGFQALNLVLQFGVRRIALVGFDMNDKDGVHWHEPHKGTNPNRDVFARWRAALESEAETLAKIGVEVVNVSPGSAIIAFQKMTIAEAVERWQMT